MLECEDEATLNAILELPTIQKNTLPNEKFWVEIGKNSGEKIKDELEKNFLFCTWEVEKW